MKVYIASDHGGFEDKNNLIEDLRMSIDELVDLGPKELNEDDDYPDYAFKVAEEVARNEGSLGILICRSGNGMVIAANKVTGAYAALCFSVKHAEMARRDDNANIICLDADYGNSIEHVAMIKTFLITEFEGMESRHGRRFNKIKDYEQRNNN